MYDYDAWKTGWYEDSHLERGCKDCQKHEQKLDSASDWLAEVVSQLYSESPLDNAKLERALDELCWLLGVKLDEGFLQVERKTRVKSILFDDLVKLNKTVLNDIKQEGTYHGNI
jgi:hypothetical protein